MKKKPYDVFLCHNSQDKEQIRNINQALKDLNFNPLLDEESFPPGMSWKKYLTRNIGNLSAAAIFFGGSGIGVWQEWEIDILITAFLESEKPMIPVLLPGCNLALNELPIQLQHLTAISFEKDSPDPLERLVWGITQKKPNSKKGGKIRTLWEKRNLELQGYRVGFPLEDFNKELFKLNRDL